MDDEDKQAPWYEINVEQHIHANNDWVADAFELTDTGVQGDQIGQARHADLPTALETLGHIIMKHERESH